MTALGLAAALPFNQTKGDPLLSLGPVFAIRAKDSVEGEQWALNKGTGGQVLRARYGSVGRAEIRRGVGLILPGTSGNYASIPDPSVLSGATELDIRFYIASYTSSAQFVLGQGDGTSGSSLSFNVSMSGNIISLRASDGTSAVLASSSLPFDSWIDSTGALAVKITWRSSDGRVQFFSKASSINTFSSDLVNNTGWTAVGVDQTSVAAPLYDYAKELTFGCLGTSLLFSGIIYAVQIATVIDGTPFVSTNFTQQGDLTTSFTCATGQTVTVTAANAVDTNDPKLLKQSNTSYVYLPGTAGDADSINTSSLTTGASNVYDIRVLADLDSMTPSSDRTLFSYTASDPNRSIRWYLETTGKLIAEVTPTGSIASFISMASSTTVGASGKLWFRVTVEGNVAGSYRTRFYRCDGNIVSPTVSDWVQIGTDVSGAGFTFATCSATWGTVGTAALQGKWYRTTLATSIDGAPLIDLSASNIVDPTLTTFTCTTGQTCSIGRSAAGRKTVVVTQPVWLFGTDDYLEVLDNDLLDFNNIDHTVLVITRWWNTAIPYGAIVVKNQTAPFNDGWTLAQNNGSGIFPRYFEDEVGSIDVMGLDNTATQGQLFLFAGIREGTVNKSYVNNTMTSVSAPDVSDLRNSGVMRIGSTPFNAYYADMELCAVYIFRKALTAAEIAAGVQYWNAA